MTESIVMFLALSVAGGLILGLVRPSRLVALGGRLLTLLLMLCLVPTILRETTARMTPLEHAALSCLTWGVCIIVATQILLGPRAFRRLRSYVTHPGRKTYRPYHGTPVRRPTRQQQPAHTGRREESRAFAALRRAVRDGRVKPGHDLHDGSPLPTASIQKGHCMSPENHSRALRRMDANPDTCHWCGARLSTGMTQKHFLPHSHGSDTRHHFHPACWDARRVATGIILDTENRGDARDMAGGGATLGPLLPGEQSLEIEQIYRVRVRRRT